MILNLIKEKVLQKIDFDAIIKNARYFKSIIGNAKLCAVIKNDAYGHGIVHTARFLSGAVDFFAVGSVDEAEKAADCSREVLILLPQDYANTCKAIKTNCLLTVDSFDTLMTVCKAAKIMNVKAKVHIKIDSGMSRLGFSVSDIKPLLKAIKKCGYIDVQGVYSHFWGDTIDACDKQYESFLYCANSLGDGLGKDLIRHIANSSAALLSDKYRLDMVRIGLGLYGYGNERLIPAKKVSARVIAVRSVDCGSVVGYGGVFVPDSFTRIAVINTGYASGLSRALVGSYVKINGKFCKIVAVCMAMSMVDIGMNDVSVGDDAILLGDGVNLSNDKVIVYELLCNLR